MIRKIMSIRRCGISSCDNYEGLVIYCWNILCRQRMLSYDGQRTYIKEKEFVLSFISSCNQVSISQPYLQDPFSLIILFPQIPSLDP
jgi:hypothetical protein